MANTSTVDKLKKRGLYNELYMEIQQKMTVAHNRLDRAMFDNPPRTFMHEVGMARFALDEACDLYKELEKLFINKGRTTTK